ncbi:MAG: helix-turn-helix domain-containing protein [Bacteroidetes bacterium]|nr:helix-turn-helix domain-containing protein [Bacteroidota bacterium]
MKREQFKELVASIEEAIAIQRGEKFAAVEHVFEEPDARQIRARMKLSQSAFAAVLGISLRTLQNWEQGHRVPQGPARRLLEVAARYPDAVYNTVFGRRELLRRNPDGSITTVIAGGADASTFGSGEGMIPVNAPHHVNEPGAGWHRVDTRPERLAPEGARGWFATVVSSSEKFFPRRGTTTKGLIG